MKKYYYLVIAVIGLSACNSNKQNVAQTQQAQGPVYNIFAIIGDYGTANDNEKAVAALVKGWKPHFIATVGDNSYNDDEDDKLQKNVGDIYRGLVTDSTFYTCPGNHDHANNKDNKLDKYKAYFNRERNYHVTMPKNYCYLYFLDSGWDGNKDGGILDDETKDSLLSWLKADTLNYFKLVFFHHPVYSDGRHACSSRTQIGFDTMNVDAVINGHDHLYERIDAKGNQHKKPLYLVNGSGGADLYTDHNPDCIPASMEVKKRNDTNWGALKVICNSNKLDFLFYSSSGQLVDSSSIMHNQQTTEYR